MQLSVVNRIFDFSASGAQQLVLASYDSTTDELTCEDLLAGGLKTVAYYVSGRKSTLFEEINSILELVFIKIPRDEHMGILQWLKDSPQNPWQNAEWAACTRLTMLAAALCDLEVLQTLAEWGTALSPDVWLAAMQYNRNDVMEWMFKETPSRPDVRAFQLGALRQLTETLRWLVEVVGCPIEHDNIVTLDDAAKSGNFELVFLLQSYGCPWDYNTFCIAVDGGATLDDLKALHAKGCPATNGIGITMCASKGNKETILWLRSLKPIPCAFVAPAMDKSILHGQPMEMLEWLISLGCPISPGDCLISAAEAERMDACTWVYDRYASDLPEIPPYAAVMAARKGNMEILSWLFARSCPCSDLVALEACHGGHLHVLKHLLLLRAPWKPIECAEEALIHGHIGIYDWIQHFVVTMTPTPPPGFAASMAIKRK